MSQIVIQSFIKGIKADGDRFHDDDICFKEELVKCDVDYVHKKITLSLKNFYHIVERLEKITGDNVFLKEEVKDGIKSKNID